MTPKTYSIAEFDQAFPDTQPMAQGTPTPTETPNQYGAIFRATGEEGAVKAGLKAAGNVPTSAFNLGKGIVGAVTSPIQTAKGVGGLIADLGATVTNKLTDITGLGQKREQTSAKALSEAYFGEQGRYGSKEQALKTAIEDPFGVGSDILGVISGGAGALGKTAALGRGISMTSKVATAPVRGVFSGFGKAVTGSSKFGLSQATGLSPETISTITKNPRAFGEAQATGATRTDLAENVLGAVKTAQDELSDLGAGYQAIRETPASVSLPQNWVRSSLDKYGLKFQNTKVSADKTSATRNVTDINKIQEFIDNWGDARTLTPEEYLNMRHDLAELAKYDMSGKSTVVRQFAQDVREGMLNSKDVRGQIPGLGDLDIRYAADKTFLNKIEKDFIDPKTGGLKDGAASKVVNAINAANPERLARLEQLYPGFTKQAQVVKAVEDVENAMGLKVGTYARAGVAVTGVLTGNAPVIVAAILSTPEIAVPLLKGYGITAEKVGPILQAVTNAASDINNFRVPGAIEQYLKENYKNGVPVGLSTKNVGIPKGTTDSDLKIMRDYADMVFDKNTKLPDATQAAIEKEMSEVAKRLGLKNEFGGREALANEVGKILDNAQFDETLPSFNQGAIPETTDLTAQAAKMRGEGIPKPNEIKGSTVYHGTPNKFEGEPNYPFYLTTDKKYASVYQNPSASSLSTNRTAGEATVLEFRVNQKARVLDLRTPEGEKALKDYWSTASMSGEKVPTASGLPDWTEAENIAEYIQENKLPFDAVLIDEGGTIGFDGVQSRGAAFVALNGNALTKAR